MKQPLFLNYRISIIAYALQDVIILSSQRFQHSLTCRSYDLSSVNVVINQTMTLIWCFANLIKCFLDNVLIFCGEISYWSYTGVKGLTVKRVRKFKDKTWPRNHMNLTVLSCLLCNNVFITLPDLLANAFWLCIVSLLWGSTNPLIRQGSKGIEDIHRPSRIGQFFAEVLFLVSNWRVRYFS